MAPVYWLQKYDLITTHLKPGHSERVAER